MLLEAVLRTDGKRTILVPFGDLGLHERVLRDTITTDWLTPCSTLATPTRSNALDCADFDALEAARRLDLPNPDTGPIQRALEAAVANATTLPTP